MSKKSSDYYAAFDAESARIARRPGHFESLAQQVSRALGRDEARKQRIIARSPGTFAAMDANELGAASSIELAKRELRELGIDVGDNDPEALLDAHHAGRQWARDRARGRASDSAEPTFLDAYLREGE